MLIEHSRDARATGTRTPNSGARNRCVANYTIALTQRAEYSKDAHECQEKIRMLS